MQVSPLNSAPVQAPVQTVSSDYYQATPTYVTAPVVVAQPYYYRPAPIGVELNFGYSSGYRHWR